MIYEVVATHILFFYFIESSYSIATVLCVFLFGLGVGSLLIYHFSNKIKDKKLLFAVLQISIAVYAFIVLSNLVDILPNISVFGTVVVSFLILLVPTIFLGAIFPLAGSIFKKGKKEIIGLVYSTDLFGAILGSLLAGFLLIPMFGAKIAVIFGAGLNTLSAFLLFSKKQRVIPVMLVAILVLSTINFSSLISNVSSITTDEPVINNDFIIDNEEYYSKEGYQFYANSAYGLVTVQNDALSIDGRQQCCLCYPDYASERQMAIYALGPLKKYEDIDILNVGLGCGLTLEKCLELETEVDVVEINEKVVLANRVLSDVLEDPRVNLIIDDGLSYLRKNDKKYDSILIDIENPSVAHASNLYTVDAFKIVKQSLKNNGTFALWCYSGNDRYLDILYYSLSEAFDHIYSYGVVFLATDLKLSKDEYIASTDYEINTIDRNTLTDAFLKSY